MSGVELTILLPCLNERETIGRCIERAHKALSEHALVAEILVADNGSDDGSIPLAEQLGARVIHVPVRGYGAALRAGINGARGNYIIFADADDSYYIEDLKVFVDALQHGCEFVIGNRFAKGIEPGAMPWLNRLGNPCMSWIGRLLFGGECRDWHCGMRGLNRRAFEEIPLECNGMEFASEMIAKAQMHGVRIQEVPTGLRRDGRSRPPHLRPWRDGLRHLWLLIKLRCTYRITR